MTVRAPRSLADDLRQRDDAALSRLLRVRPDLVRPVPSDLTALATRATTAPSVARFIDGLDALRLHVLRIAAAQSAHDPTTDEAILSAAGMGLGDDGHEAVVAALADAVDAALVWGTPRARHVVHAVRDLIGASPAPIWPPPQARLTAALAQADVDAQGALHARETLGLVRDLLDDWSAHPPGVLRSGGLSLRDFAAARRRLHADWPRTALVIEVAHAARLVADDHDDPPHWIPTDHFDGWLAQHTAEQWTALVRAWLALPRLASVADERTQVLSPDRDRGAIPVLRRQVLDILVAAPPGSAVSAESTQQVLDFRQPRRAGELRQLTVEATLREAADLGLTAGGALSTAGRLLLSPADGGTTRAQDKEVAAALSGALPEDLNHVVIQADLTIVAPGPLVAHVARTMRLLADVESRGHATVYRISEDSIRRALDAGWDAASIHSHLADISRTPIPQPLSYLVDDVARRHGAVRIGGGLGYARCDNPETLAAILGDRRLRPLGLHRIADTVLMSQAPARELVEALRAAGYAPAAESPDGQVIIRGPGDRRTRAPRTALVTVRRTPEETLVNAAVRSLRAGDRATRHGGTTAGPAGSVDLPSLSAAAIVSRLRSATADTRPVWIGYADTDGTVTQQVVDPIRVAAGVLTAFDHRTEQVRQFAVSRVTGIADLPTLDQIPSQDEAPTPSG
ncbi:MAG: helicase-associated domain-containing protein [Actinomycetota bacterium]|nr:helicase-associated domain-containing protein [Actinomycetota bacterium]